MDAYKINIRQDGDGYLAEIAGYDYLYARGTTKTEATQELAGVFHIGFI